jgi:glycosyltransferase involved in cell wall biosynthesis
MKSSTLGIVSFGDPLSPRNWSGTPRNLINAFHEIDIPVSVVGIAPSFPMKLALRAMSYAIGAGPTWQRSRVASIYNSKFMDKYKSAGVKVVLHMGTTTLPSLSRQTEISHAIYIDYTYHQVMTSGMSAGNTRYCATYDDYERRALLYASHVFTTSQYVRNDIIAHYGVPQDRVSAVGTGMGSIKPYRGEKDYRSKTILFVAKNRFEDKGGPLLLAGYNLAVRQDPEMRLVVVGEDSYRAQVESLPNATFLTSISWERLEDLFRTSSIFVMPAKQEPWGLVYLEAQLSRTPVMGLEENALPELTNGGKTGFLIKEAKAESVAQKLCEAFSDVSRLEKLGWEGQDFVLNNFSWEKTVRAIASRLLP